MKKILYSTDQKNPDIIAYKEAVEKGKKDQHILPKDNGWVVKNLLSVKITNTFNTQQEAINYAERHASQGSAIFVHGENGLIVNRKDIN